MLEQVAALSEHERTELASGDSDLPELDSDTKVAYDAAFLLAGPLGRASSSNFCERRPQTCCGILALCGSCARSRTN